MLIDKREDLILHVLNYQVFVEELLLVSLTMLSDCICTEEKQRTEAEGEVYVYFINQQAQKFSIKTLCM